MALKLKELMLWTVFVVLAGLYPIWVVYNAKRTAQLPIDWTELIIQGELLMVAFAIAADSISRVFSRIFRTNQPRRGGNWQLLGILCSIVFLVMAGSEYSSLHSTIYSSINASYIASQSLILFFAALLTGGGLVLLG